MGTTPHTIRLTDDQVDRITDHGTIPIADAIRNLIDSSGETIKPELPQDPSILRDALHRARRITITLTFNP